MNLDAHLAFQRAKVKTVTARAEATLARLGGESSRHSLTDGMSAEQIERDAQSIRRILGVWRRIGKRDASPITLPSGRRLVPKSSTTERITQREYAIGRPLRDKGKGRK